MIEELFTPQNVEALKIKYAIVPYTKGIVLDLGCGPWKTYPHFIGIDLRENWPKNIPWGPDINMDCRTFPWFTDESVDSIFSSYLLNELDDPRAALKEWWRMVKIGGYLVLYVPYDKNQSDLTITMEEIGSISGWDQEENEITDDGTSLFQVYRKRDDGVFNCYAPKSAKTCAVVRFGAVGDMIQTSSILPELKKQGYHVTLYTSENGYPIIRHDPHVDRFIVQQHEQVPNRELSAYWAYLKGKYDKFVNLSESVEATLLAMNGRIVFDWPHGARDKILDFNYLEIMHLIAEVPFEIHTKFYATQKEINWARFQKRKCPGKAVLWVLSGSSVHKAWPYMDSIIARLLLDYPDIRIFLSGDPLSEMLEAGWENEERIIKTSGKWDIRESLAFACHAADMVIGPETGVLNAVSMLDIPKIICLSHSSVNNLTRDWVNTISLTPVGCPCQPCHQMHNGFERCSRDPEVGVSECQAKISPDMMLRSIYHFSEKNYGKVRVC